MFNKNFIIAATLSVGVIFFASCSSQSLIVPQATSTINSVNLGELRLNHETDYTILNTISAEATVIYTSKQGGKKVEIEEENGEFKLEFKYDSKKNQYTRTGFDGVARFGFLSNDYSRTYTDVVAPEYVARNIAIYRLINAAKVSGADGVVEPIVSTNVSSQGKRNQTIIFRTIVSGKPMKLNVDAK